jgi:YbbR domain-containing protein
MILSTIFWFLIKLSKPYTSVLTVQVEYVNQPEDKVVVNNLPDQFKLNVSGTGWQLFRYFLKSDKAKLFVNVGNYTKQGVIHTNNNRFSFNDQLPSDLNITQISPSEVRFTFENRKSKKVPVILNADISINPQYGLKDDIGLIPDSVIVSGPESLIDTLTGVHTELLEIKDIGTNQSGKVHIQGLPLKSVQYNIEEIEYRFSVEQYTEGNIEIPVVVSNMSADEIVLLTKSANVSFQIPIEKFELIQDPSFIAHFEIIADFQNIQPADSIIGLQVVSFPNFVRNIQVKPDRVRFLFHKK